MKVGFPRSARLLGEFVCTHYGIGTYVCIIIEQEGEDDLGVARDS